MISNAARTAATLAGLILALKIKGYGASYGFERIAALGMDLQEAADRGDHEAVAAHILLYREYLDKVRITFA